MSIPLALATGPTQPSGRAFSRSSLPVPSTRSSIEVEENMVAASFSNCCLRPTSREITFIASSRLTSMVTPPMSLTERSRREPVSRSLSSRTLSLSARPSAAGTAKAVSSAIPAMSPMWLYSRSISSTTVRMYSALSGTSAPHKRSTAWQYAVECAADASPEILSARNTPLR